MRKIDQNKYHRWLVLSSLVSALLAISGCSIGSNNEPMVGTPGSPQSVRCDHYSFHFTTEPEGDGETLEIRCDSSEVVYSASADHLGIISSANIDSEEDRISPGDIDGDGVPDFIIQETSGNCCVDYTFISLGNEVRSVPIERIGGDVELVDLDKDGKFEIKALETTFIDRLWGNRFDEPAPNIILEAKKDRFELGTRFMKSRSMDPTEDFTKARRGLRLLQSLPFSEKVSLVEKVYRGQGEECLAYLDAVYNGTRFQGEKDEMVNETISALLSSPYWEQIAAMNRWQYEQPDGELACPEFAGRRWLMPPTK